MAIVVAAPFVRRQPSACPGLHQKPLDAAIRQLLAPYRPGCRHDDNQQNNDAKCVHFADHFDGRGGAPVLSRALPDGGGPWLSYKPLNTAIGRALAPIASIAQSNFGCFFDFIMKSLKKSSSCPNNNRGVTYQSDGKDLADGVEYLNENS